jgi:hypothetical protein
MTTQLKGFLLVNLGNSMNFSLLSFFSCCLQICFFLFFCTCIIFKKICVPSIMDRNGFDTTCIEISIFLSYFYIVKDKWKLMEELNDKDRSNEKLNELILRYFKKPEPPIG